MAQYIETLTPSDYDKAGLNFVAVVITCALRLKDIKTKNLKTGCVRSVMTTLEEEIHFS